MVTERKKPWLWLGLVATAGIGLLLLNQYFFFSPLAYRRCSAAHLPWARYINPLQLEYGVLDGDGWKFFTTLDKDEIRLVFKEISRCAEQAEPGELEAGVGASVWFGIRRLRDGAVLLSAEGREDGIYFQVRDLATVSLTPELQALLLNRIQEARN